MLKIVRNRLAVADSLAIFFCCHYHGRRESVGCPTDGGDISPAELMVVREIEMPDYLVCVCKIVSERPVVRDAREQDKPVCIDISWIAFREDRLRLVVSDGREEYMRFPFCSILL